MNLIARWMAHRVLATLLRKRCAPVITISGDEGARLDCYSTRIVVSGGRQALVTSLVKNEVEALEWNGATWEKKVSYDLRELRNTDFAVTHYYRLNQLQIDRLSTVFWHSLLPIYYRYLDFKLRQEAARQKTFNKRNLVTPDRIEVLKILLNNHISNARNSMNAIDVMSRIHSDRWVMHPDQLDAQSRLRLYLDSLVDSGELALNGGNYYVRGKAVTTLYDY